MADRKESFANFMRHNHDVPCDSNCGIHGPNFPVEGDTWNLQRFIEAQDWEDTFSHAVQELKSGKKRTHWIWFVFPQLWGLPGKSETANRFALRCIAEAEDYVSHPILRERFEEVCAALDSNEINDPETILGDIDALKLRSSLTLFAYIGRPFLTCDKLLKRFYSGVGDDLTLRLLAADVRRTSASKAHDEPHGVGGGDENQIQLQSGKNGDVWLNLSCRLDNKGDFLIEGHDMGSHSEYEWQTVVRAEHVPQLIALIGDGGDTDLLTIVRRDWLPVEGERLERLIKLSSVPSKFSSYGSFP
jgi:uncharacterized protein (DUF1810 family)